MSQSCHLVSHLVATPGDQLTRDHGVRYDIPHIVVEN